MPLASIQQIAEINPIPNADKIEVAKVLGWEVVVRKGEFNPGDLCVYVEIDTIIPRKEWSEFLFQKPEETEYRLRTIKLRGQLSQGLVLPLWGEYNLGTIIGSESDDCFDVGRDVSILLGIKKYEKPVSGGYNPKSGNPPPMRNFPSFIPKTDEVRVQSYPDLLEKLQGKSYQITQKLDGTSSTYYKYQGKFGVCSRNLELPDPRTPKGWWKQLVFKVKKKLGKVRNVIPDTDVYWKMAFKYNIEEWLPDGYAIQGEICGPGVQGNKLGLTEPHLFIFNIWNISTQKYERESIFQGIQNKNWELVPLLDIGNEFRFSQEELLEKAKGVYANGTPQEGIVIRDIDQRISFKVINNEFLLKYGE